MRKFILLFFFALLTPGLVNGQSDEAFLPGHIAFVGTDRNIYRIDLVNNQVLSLTDDATQTRTYSWPTWANDNRLAYVREDQLQNARETEVFVSADSFTDGTRVFRTTTEGFTYVYWAPENCPTDSDCRDLALLMSNPLDGLFSVHLVRNTPARSDDTLIGRGAPFYFSWSPDGRRLLWQRDNERFDIYDVDQATVTRLPFRAGVFQAPAWSPIDDRWLIGTDEADGTGTALTIVSTSSEQTLVTGLTGPAAFNWSPDGNFIAYVDGTGPVVVLNAENGQVEARSPVSGVYAFFWSPNSKSVAYLTLGSTPGSIIAAAPARNASLVQNVPTIAWSVLDIQTGSNRRFGSFIPTSEMIYMLRFFDQFAQSHRLWSPDSRYIVYAEQLPTGPTISVLDTSEDNTVPFSIADGLFATWSFK